MNFFKKEFNFNQQKEKEKEKNISVLKITEEDFFNGNFDLEDEMFNGIFETNGEWRKLFKIGNLIVTKVEIFVLKKLKELKAERNKNGVLMITLPGLNDKIPFTANKFAKFIFKYKDKKMNPKVKVLNPKGEKTEIHLNSNGTIFLKEFLPNLKEKEILLESDFSVLGNSDFSKIYPMREKILKNGLNEFVLRGEAGPIKYYIGRSKIYGTKTKINPETMSLVQLDINTFAILEKNIFGKKNIIFTFKAVSEEERDDLILNFKKNKEFKNTSDMVSRIRKCIDPKVYNMKDFIPKKGNENKQEYESRLMSLSDIDTILGKSRQFTAESSMPILEFSWSDQLKIFSVLSTLSHEKKERINQFLKKYGLFGFKTFLSVEYSDVSGDKILNLGESESLPEGVANKVFEKYGEIVDNVNKITEFAINNFTKEIKTTPELIGKIEETLYLKGKQLLLNTYEDILNKKEINSEEIIKHLNRINADTITTFAIFKQAVRNGEKLPIENIEGAIFSKKEASDIENNQQNEMFELYESNWKNHPDRNFVESLKEYFKTAFIPEDNKQKNFFYTFEKDNNIRAFVRFEEKDKKHLYASALNVDEASKNFGLGEAMMDEALVREAQKNILYASCKKDNPSNMRYFEKGFISRGFKKTNETEEFDLVWDENKNKVILAKQKSKEELIKMYLANNYEGNDIEMKSSENLEELNSFIPKDKAMVRCFFDNAKWYAVYEKVDEDYGMNFGEIK